MNTEDKLIKMYNAVHGEISSNSACYLELWEEDYSNEPIGIKVMKHGNVCSYYKKEDLLFDYITIDW